MSVFFMAMLLMVGLHTSGMIPTAHQWYDPHILGALGMVLVVEVDPVI
jgi:hypothetical protein